MLDIHVSYCLRVLSVYSIRIYIKLMAGQSSYHLLQALFCSVLVQETQKYTQVPNVLL